MRGAEKLACWQNVCIVERCSWLMSWACAYTCPERPAGEQSSSRPLRPQSRFRKYESQCHISEKLAPAASRQPRPLSLRPSCRSGPLVGRALNCRLSTMHVDRKLLPQPARTSTSSLLCVVVVVVVVKLPEPCLACSPFPGEGLPLHPLYVSERFLLGDHTS